MQWETHKVYWSFYLPCGKEVHNEGGANPNSSPFLSIVLSEKCPFHVSQWYFPAFGSLFLSGNRIGTQWNEIFFNPWLKRWLFLLHYDKNSLSQHAEIWLKVTKVAEGDEASFMQVHNAQKSEFSQVSLSLCFQVPSGHSPNHFTPEFWF